jgi:predicted DsbA family dithiol-disulfide isomerase
LAGEVVTMKVEIYSDVACPWCYIGHARFERALDTFEAADRLEVRYRPYQLDPNAPTRAVPMLEYLERRFGAQARAMASRVIAIAREEGLDMDYDRGLAVNTLNAHRLLALAQREHGAKVQRALLRRLFSAHFCEGRDVSNVHYLAVLSLDVGMDGEATRAYLSSDAGTREVQEEIAEARRLGVDAVPTFVFDDKYVVEGAHPTPQLVEVLNQVARESAGSRA